jgi:SagB-type dehydrogenase family enzyme
MPHRPLLRRHASIVSYWLNGSLIFENYATGVRISAQPAAAEVLHFFDRWRSVDAAIARLAEYAPASLRTLIAALERCSFLTRAGAPVDHRSQLMQTWAAWNPAGGFYHMSTKDGRYARSAEIREIRYRKLFRKALHSPLPPFIKRYRGARRVRLPPFKTRGEFPEVLLARRTWRDFSRRPVTLVELSTLLGLTWRVQGWLDSPGQGRLPLKTSPSGGARHPLEAYVWARRVSGLRPGIYHYAADRHLLEQLTKDGFHRRVISYLPTQRWYEPASALILITAVFPRVQWKYEFPRAYRVVLAEAGHFCQTFCLTATWLGLAPFCSMALADSRIERDLGIDGITESVVYVAGVGRRPRDRSKWPKFVATGEP